MKQLAPNSTRVEWVDVARGIGIIAVVYGHVLRGIHNAGVLMPTQFYAWSDSLIYSFHMPLFFILSGLFFLSSHQKQTLGAFLAHRLQTLAYPYVLWSLLQGSIETWFSRQLNEATQPIELSQILWQPRDHFWFLHNLLIIIIIAAVVATVTKRSKLVLSVVAIALFVSPWRYPSVNYFFLFFVIGIWVVPFLFRPKWSPQQLTLGSVAATAGWLLFATIKITNNITLGLLPIVTALFGAGSIVLGSIWLSQRDVPVILVIFGRNSLFIYLAHVLAGSGIRILLLQLGLTNLALHIVAGTVGGLVLPLLLYRLMLSAGSSLLLVPPQLFRTSRQGVHN